MKPHISSKAILWKFLTLWLRGLFAFICMLLFIHPSTICLSPMRDSFRVWVWEHAFFLIFYFLIWIKSYKFIQITYLTLCNIVNSNSKQQHLIWVSLEYSSNLVVCCSHQNQVLFIFLKYSITVNSNTGNLFFFFFCQLNKT